MSRCPGCRRPSTWTNTKHVEDEEIAVGAGLWAITGTLTVEMSYDEYGADADGRRGVMVTDESDRTFTLASAALCGVDGEFGVPLTGAAIPADVVKATDEWAMNEEVQDDGADDEDEPDYDDWRERREDARMDREAYGD